MPNRDEFHSVPVSRRAVLIGAGAASLGVPLLDGCAAAGAVANPAVAGWLGDLAIGVGASLIATGISEISDSLWSMWRSSAETTLTSTGATWVGDSVYANAVPPVMLIAAAATAEPSPLDQSLLAFVYGGAHVVPFKPWAWQGLSMFVKQLTRGHEGDELAVYRALCGFALAPSGVAPVTGDSPSGALGWMSYTTRAGLVTIDRMDDQVRVTVAGIPKADGTPTVGIYRLPTKAA